MLLLRLSKKYLKVRQALGTSKVVHLSSCPVVKSDPWDMLSNFCFRVYAPKWLFIYENSNVFFTSAPVPLTLVHRAGSQLKIQICLLLSMLLFPMFVNKEKRGILLLTQTASTAPRQRNEIFSSIKTSVLRQRKRKCENKWMRWIKWEAHNVLLQQNS